jgi:hypothetical protein
MGIPERVGFAGQEKEFTPSSAGHYFLTKHVFMVVGILHRSTRSAVFAGSCE